MGDIVPGPWKNPDDRHDGKVGPRRRSHMSVRRTYTGPFAHMRARLAYDRLSTVEALDMVAIYRPTLDPRTWFSSGVEASAIPLAHAWNERLERNVRDIIGSNDRVRIDYVA